MSDPKPLMDKIGNELHEGDFVTVTFNGPPVGRVMKLHEGGIHLGAGNSTTPALIRITVDMTIRTEPGSSLQSVLRIPDPRKEYIMKKLIDEANKLPDDLS